MKIKGIKKEKHVSAVRRIGFSFFAVIVVGSILLSLPAFHRGDISYVNHLFTATSATCVTGLVTLTVVEDYTFLGQLVILVLIQIGGLGFLTFLSMFIVFFKKKLTYKTRIVMQEALNQNSIDGINFYINRVIKYTAFFEIVGALLLSIVFIPDYGLERGIYYAVFHSVSAFCNAGFDLLGSSSLLAYQTNILVNMVVCGLIISGGLGFVVWIELKHKIFDAYKKKIGYKKVIKNISVHAKIVLVMTVGLIFSGMLIFLCLEYNNYDTIGNLSLFNKLQASFFQSVTLRTAGFATIDIASAHDATKFFMCAYMLIGGSPAGTAGGIKTVTFAMILLSIYKLAEGRKNVAVFRRQISNEIVSRATSIATISLFICIIATFMLSISETGSFIDIMFEVFSAFGTVGLSASFTSTLTVFGKLVIICLMFVGRIGPITMMLIFVNRYNQQKGKEIEYPKGDVLIG